MNDDQKRDVVRRAQNGTLLDIFNAIEQAVVTELAASVPPLTIDEARAALVASQKRVDRLVKRAKSLRLRLAAHGDNGNE